MQLNELEPRQLAVWLHNGELVRVIDVRSPGEASRGTIPHAENLPLHLLPLRAEKVSSRRRTVFCCRSGELSAQACEFMSMRGFGGVYHLKGGLDSWIQTGLPLSEPVGSSVPLQRP
jgi:rhodanese-related sulfurtransferase